MNGRRIVSLAWKEWREIVRDRLFFALAFFVPTLLMVLFGFVGSVAMAKFLLRGEAIE